MDRELSKNIILRRRSKNIVIGAISLLFIIFLILLFRSIFRPTIKLSEIRTAVAEKGSIEATITASGTIVPEYEQMLTSPIQARILSVVHQAGSTIKPGESILELDKDATMHQLAKMKDEYELTRNRKKQMQLSLRKTLIDLQTQLDIKQIEVELLKSELSQKQKIYKIGGASKSELEQSEMKYRIAQKETERLFRQIETQNESSATELSSLDLEIEIQKKNLEELQRQLELAEIKAEHSGVVTWVNDEIGASVTPGEVIARIADLSSYKVKGNISDIFADRIQPGGPVKVQLGDSMLTGQINQIQPQIEDGTLTFFVKLDGKAHPGLRSNLRVDLHVITSFKENVIRVKNGPFARPGLVQNIFLLKEEKAVRREAKVGVANVDFVEIETWVNPGEVVIISDMKNYLEMKEIEIEN